ncbi:conjugal transfer protein MobA [Sphingobacterium siyangense]|nr:conjugal transfer protein MobA [Sphingobacterium siyangense]
MEENRKQKQKNVGRKPKINPSTHRHVFRLTNEENAKLLSLFEASGMNNKAKFIITLIFNRELKMVKIDKDALDYHSKLSALFSQFRAVGVNYNQIVKVLYRNFSEKKAAAYLFKLEKQTAEMALLCQQVIKLTQEFEAKYLK